MAGNKLHECNSPLCAENCFFFFFLNERSHFLLTSSIIVVHNRLSLTRIAENSTKSGIVRRFSPKQCFTKKLSIFTDQINQYNKAAKKSDIFLIRKAAKDQ